MIEMNIHSTIYKAVDSWELYLTNTDISEGIQLYQFNKETEKGPATWQRSLNWYVGAENCKDLPFGLWTFLVTAICSSMQQIWGSKK